MNQPGHLFVIGMPRSGTSSLFSWLGQHEKIQASNEKETFFFMDPENPFAGRHGLSVSVDGEQAFDRFFDGPANGRIRLEATTHSFYQNAARDYLTLSQTPSAVVMLLREPGARLHSYFCYHRDNRAFVRNSLSFDEYIDRLLSGKMKMLEQYFRNTASFWVAKRELRLGKYVQWIDWWLERMPRERVNIILFEELTSDPVGVLMALCKNIGVDAEFFRNYDLFPRNEAQAIGMQPVHRLVLRAAPLLPRGKLRESIKQRYLGWQRKAAEEEVDYVAGLQQIREYFLPWNRALAARHNLDLRRWWDR